MRKLFRNKICIIDIDMNTSRTSAAQRRRNGPPVPERGPTTSIQSSPAFSQPPQIRTGTTGRLAGQQASLAQQQQQQQQQINRNTMNKNAINKNAMNETKMSIPQAITLITLRLGRLENQMQHLDISSMSGVDNDVMENLLQRIQDLEQKVTESSSIKQQFDIIKPVVANVKNASTTASKEVKDLKTNINMIKSEMKSLQAVVSDLQLFMNSECGEYDNNDDNDNNVNLNLNNANDIIELGQNIEYYPEELDLENENELDTELENENEKVESINLKEMVEQELNCDL